jgi:O-6-methylguanine DNA methyltransferase
MQSFFGILGDLYETATTMQLRVWSFLYAIPRGETRTYAQVARACDCSPKEVAATCAQNPFPVLIPCHRVVISDGRLGPYTFGGQTRKAELLQGEGVFQQGLLF